MLKPLHSFLIVILTVVIETILLFLLVFVYGESEMKWSFYELPNNYEIYRKNLKLINITKDDKSVIDDYVLEVQFDKRYIMIKGIDNKELKGISKKEIEAYLDYKESKLDRMNYRYYLIDTETDDIKGPLSKDEYDSSIDDYGLDEETLFYWFRMY